MKQLFLALALFALSFGAAAAQNTTIVNGVELTPDEQASLAYKLGQPVLAGRYWYDPMSGLWGVEGGPAMGQMWPDLPEFRGALRADASGGQTEVFVNGRAIHPTELMQLQQMMGPIPAGRYALNAYGQVAIEGQPFPPLPPQGYGQGQMAGANNGWWGGNSVYMPGRGSDGSAQGLHVGQASDGCTYIVTGDYSAESC